jgi:PIN domain nuclease of toxin-antitoxin system
LGEQVIVLDTHVLLWTASDPDRLSKRAREVIRKGREEAEIAIATITLWEVAWLAQNGRVVVTTGVESFVRETVGVRLPEPFPRDPADRLIAATAMVEGSVLVTADSRIRQSKVLETVW